MSATPLPRRHRLLAWSFALVIGASGTWLLHRHQFASAFDLFPGPRGDTRLTAYLCEHWYQALQNKVELLSPSIFYPEKGTLGYSDALLLFVPPYSLMRAVGLDIFTALAIVVVIFNFLNFIAGFALLFHALRLRWLPSVAGAMFFSFNNTKLSQADHLALQPVWLLPIIGACVVAFVRNAQSLSAKRACGLLALAALALDLQLLTGFYVGWFLVFWSALFLGLATCFRQTRELLVTALRVHWRPVLGAAGVWAAGLVPFLIVYLPVVRKVGGWPYDTAVGFIPEIRSYLLMADGNFVWSRVSGAILQPAGQGQWLGVADWERRVGSGVVATLTWLGLSVFAVRARTRRPLLAAAILSVNLLILLTLQYHGHSLWRAVYAFVPGAKSIRAVARFMIVAALPISIAFAFAVERAQQWIGGRVGLHAMLVALIAFGTFEQFTRGDGGYYSIRAENKRLQRLAAKLPNDCVAFYAAARSPGNQPLEWPPRNQQGMQRVHDAMLVSILRGVPTLNGRSGKSPPGGWALGEVMAPDYEEKVREWIALQKLGGRVCRLEIAE